MTAEQVLQEYKNLCAKDQLALLLMATAMALGDPDIIADPVTFSKAG